MSCKVRAVRRHQPVGEEREQFITSVDAVLQRKRQEGLKSFLGSLLSTLDIRELKQVAPVPNASGQPRDGVILS